jgi:glycosyltransferase involved in cell wall biosynthesis
MSTSLHQSHLVLIPSYNSGILLEKTVAKACEAWPVVWVVIDGSTDDSRATLAPLEKKHPGLKVLKNAVNQGKGAAVLYGLQQAQAHGFSYALTMDADDQHPAHRIQSFMQTSAQHPGAMILGDPVFDTSAPLLRLRGRKVSNWWANLETLWWGVHDSLFGFRIYPIAPLVRIMQAQPWMRRFDFDVEAVVRLCWAGVKPINHPAEVRYVSADEGGVSHFQYLRDNVLLTWMHLRLMAGFLLRLPLLVWRRLVERV